MKTQSLTARRIRLGAAAMAASAAIVRGSMVPASAASYNINASLNCGGALYQSDIYRAHSNGPSTSNLTKHDWWKNSWTLRTGLRVGATQTTQTLEFPPSSRSAYNYRTNGGCVVFPPTFEATLNL